MRTSMPDNSFKNRNSVAQQIYSAGNSNADYRDNASNYLMQSTNRELTRKQHEAALNASFNNESRSSSSSSSKSSSSSSSSSSSVSKSSSSSHSSSSSSSSASNSSSSSSGYGYNSSNSSSSSSSSSSFSSNSSSSSSSSSSSTILDSERAENQRTRMNAIYNAINDLKSSSSPSIHASTSTASATSLVDTSTIPSNSDLAFRNSRDIEIDENGVTKITYNDSATRDAVLAKWNGLDKLTNNSKDNDSAKSTNSSGTTVNNYYGDTYNFDGNNGAVVIGSSVTDDVNNNTNIDNSKTIVISGNTWTYSGGDKVINNYKQGEVVRLDSDYQGIDLQGNSFFVKSSSGQLEIENSRDKFIGYSAGNDEVAAYSYVASGSGDIDGRGKSQAEIMIGGDNSDNQMYAGSGGSSLWGGNGGNDVMTGGAGYDEFFYAVGSGNDVIDNAGDNDVVNLLSVSLSQITYAEVSYSAINIGFVDGGKLKLQGQSATGFRLEGVTYTANRSTGEWSIK